MSTATEGHAVCGGLEKLRRRHGLVAGRFSTAGVNKHQIDIGTVVELAASQLTSRANHGKLRRHATGIERLAALQCQIAAHGSPCHAEDRIRQVGKILGGFRKIGVTQYVA